MNPGIYLPRSRNPLEDTMGKYKVQSPIYNHDKAMKQGVKAIGVVDVGGGVLGVLGTLATQYIWSFGAKRVEARRLKRAKAEGFESYEEMVAAKKREKVAAAA
jgi:hypothetical protein